MTAYAVQNAKIRPIEDRFFVCYFLFIIKEQMNAKYLNPRDRNNLHRI